MWPIGNSTGQKAMGSIVEKQVFKNCGGNLWHKMALLILASFMCLVSIGNILQLLRVAPPDPLKSYSTFMLCPLLRSGLESSSAHRAGTNASYRDVTLY